MKLIESDNLPSAIGPYSPAVKVNGMIYTSAQVPVTLDGTMVEKDIKIQTRQVLANLRTLLEDAESGMENVVKVTVDKGAVQGSSEPIVTYGKKSSTSVA